jgi:hypothetical protein
MKIWTWQECLNYLKSRPRHSNHFSKSQSSAALLSLSQDQLFVLFLWLNPWTWQDCFNIWWLHPWHSNYCLSSTPQLEPQVLQTPTRNAHHWLGLALLVSRLLVIISEFDDGESCKADPPPLQLHPPASQRKCPVVMSCTGRHWQGSCQAAVNKPYVVCFGRMRVPVHESLAGKQAVPCRPAKYAWTATYVLRSPQYVPVCQCTLQKRKKCSTKSIKKVCTSMYWVHTSTYHFMNQKYVPGTYF